MKRLIALTAAVGVFSGPVFAAQLSPQDARAADERAQELNTLSATGLRAKLALQRTARWQLQTGESLRGNLNSRIGAPGTLIVSIGGPIATYIAAKKAWDLLTVDERLRISKDVREYYSQVRAVDQDVARLEAKVAQARESADSIAKNEANSAPTELQARGDLTQAEAELANAKADQVRIHSAKANIEAPTAQKIERGARRVVGGAILGGLVLESTALATQIAFSADTINEKIADLDEKIARGEETLNRYDAR